MYVLATYIPDSVVIPRSVVYCGGGGGGGVLVTVQISSWGSKAVPSRFL